MTSPQIEALKRHLREKFLAAQEESRRRVEVWTTNANALADAEGRQPEQHSPTAHGNKTIGQLEEKGYTPQQALDREGHSGRRGDILQEWHERRRAGARTPPPLILKFNIAGSGCDVWMSHGDPDTGKIYEEELATFEGVDDRDDPDQVTAYVSDSKVDVTFSGPGAPSTKGSNVNPGNLVNYLQSGLSDTGSNSIANLVEQVPPLILDRIPQEYKDRAGKGVVLLIKAHSRGAVAGDRIAKILLGALPQMRIEGTLLDPVPGPYHAGVNNEIDLGATNPSERTRIRTGEVAVGALDESTLLYSVSSGYSEGFTPQKVHHAKRIIISAKAHSGGTDGLVYVLDGSRFKGAQLNGLPEGVYVDRDGDGAATEAVLHQVYDYNQAWDAWWEAYRASTTTTGDFVNLDGSLVNRANIIDAILHEAFPAEHWWNMVGRFFERLPGGKIPTKNT